MIKVRVWLIYETQGMRYVGMFLSSDSTSPSSQDSQLVAILKHFGNPIWTIQYL